MRQSFARCFSPNASASHDESILTIKDSGVNGPTRRARRSKFARSGSLHSRGSRSFFRKEVFPSSLHRFATTFSEIENRDCTAKGVGYDLNSRSFEEHQKLRTGCHYHIFLKSKFPVILQDSIDRLTTELPGGNAAQRNCLPVHRLDTGYSLPMDEGA